MQPIPAATLALLAGLASAHPGHESGQGDPGSTWGGDYASENMLYLGRVPVADIDPGSRIANDCWGYTSPSGREYALIGVERGLGVVEVTDPLRPRLVAFHRGPTSDWHDVKTYGHHAYAVSEGGQGIRVYDLSGVDDGVVTHVNTVIDRGHVDTHNVAINEQSGFLYRCGGGTGNNGLHIYDLNADPSNPTPVAVYNGFYVHDAQIVTYTEGPFAGREIAFCFSGYNGGGTDTGVRVLDVTDKSDITLVSVLRYPDRGFCHQGWLSEDRAYLYVNDEMDEYYGINPLTSTRVIDVRDPANPVYIGAFTSGSTSIDHNLYTHQGLIYEANYRSGLRVFDASEDPEHPTQIAWLDTYPADDEPDFDGAWSNYPYFASGTILVSDIQQGLILARVAVDRLEFDFHHGLPEHADPFGDTHLHAHIHGVGAAAADLATTRLFTDDGSGPTETLPVSSSPMGHTDFYLPPAECGSTIEWWLQASDTDGAAWAYPVRAPVQRAGLLVASRLDIPFADDFETDRGWTVSGDAARGHWARGVPSDASRGAPPADYDASGSCYLTGPAGSNSDVDNGSTALTSPPLNLAEGSLIEYAYWVNDIPNSRATPNDGLFVEHSTDGSAWTRVRAHETAGGWRTDTLRVPDDVPAGEGVRLRFVAADVDSDNVIEAAVDAFRVVTPVCAACRADRDASGAADVNDLLDYLGAFRDPDSDAADMDHDADVDVNDLLAYLALFRAGC